MSTVRENLITARALIDTPEKFDAMGRSHSAALYKATRTWQEFLLVDEAYRAIRLRGFGWACVMETFDRAIASQPKENTDGE